MSATKVQVRRLSADEFSFFDGGIMGGGMKSWGRDELPFAVTTDDFEVIVHPAGICAKVEMYAMEYSVNVPIESTLTAKLFARVVGEALANATDHHEALVELGFNGTEVF